MTKKKECIFCNATGVSNHYEVPCSICGGVGRMKWVQDDYDQMCQKCNGSGYIGLEPIKCEHCKGKGYLDWVDDIVRPQLQKE